jgi:hypothetical protein
MKKTLIVLLVASFMLGLVLAPFRAAQASEPSLSAFCLAEPNGARCQAGLPYLEYQMLLDEMLMQPKPNARSIPVDMNEINRFGYLRLTSENGTTLYNAPGGAPVGNVAPGFTYVTALSYQDGWIEIYPGQWVPQNQTAAARPSTFAGVEIENGGLQYPMAWVLIPSFPAPYPGTSQDTSQTRLERYERVNIFATRVVDGWEWYLVGPDTWIIQTSVAKVQFTERPEGIKGRWIAVDLFEQVLVTYDEDTPTFATLVSSGLPQWSTREGTFDTYWRLVNGYMTGAEGQSDYYLVDGVPYTMYFDESISLHGTYWHDGFGYRQSHGCVNMTITDAKWVFEWTADGGYDFPAVHVFSSGEYVNG